MGAEGQASYRSELLSWSWAAAAWLSIIPACCLPKCHAHPQQPRFLLQAGAPAYSQALRCLPLPSPCCSAYNELHGGQPAPPAVRGLLGSLSAACTLTLTMPMEVVRRRLQVQVSNTPPTHMAHAHWHRPLLSCLACASLADFGSLGAASVLTYPSASHLSRDSSTVPTPPSASLLPAHPTCLRTQRASTWHSFCRRRARWGGQCCTAAPWTVRARSCARRAWRGSTGPRCPASSRWVGGWADPQATQESSPLGWIAVHTTTA